MWGLLWLTGPVCDSHAQVTEQAVKPPPQAEQSATATRPSAESTPVAAAEQEAAKQAEVITGQAEQQILDFAHREEPQLYKLLVFLKHKRPGAYQQALRETQRNQRRLEVLQQRDPELYQLERRRWKTRSKLNFVAAELSVKESPELRERLARLVADLENQEIARLTLERDRAAKQLEELNHQLATRTAELPQAIAGSLDAWQNRIRRQSQQRPKRDPSRPAPEDRSSGD